MFSNLKMRLMVAWYCLYAIVCNDDCSPPPAAHVTDISTTCHCVCQTTCYCALRCMCRSCLSHSTNLVQSIWSHALSMSRFIVLMWFVFTRIAVCMRTCNYRQACRCQTCALCCLRVINVLMIDSPPSHVTVMQPFLFLAPSLI